MTSSTLTVTEFVTARLDEDEAYARAQRLRQFAPIVDEMARPDSPARVLAQCAATRQIVEQVRRYQAEQRRLFNGWLSKDDEAPDVARALASIWSDHPDFRPEWQSCS